jgi:hypothetical protein
MSANDYDPIRVAPADLYERQRGIGERLIELEREIADIKREYARLRAHPAALAVDDLGDPIDPVVATDAAVHGLDQAGGELRNAAYRLANARGYASRLKLTEQASEDLDRRQTQQRSRAERTR